MVTDGVFSGGYPGRRPVAGALLSGWAMVMALHGSDARAAGKEAASAPTQPAPASMPAPASAAPGAPPAPGTDPLILLRDRLAERLGAKPGQPPRGATAVPVLDVPASGSGELHLKADASSRPAAASARRQGARDAKHSTARTGSAAAAAATALPTAWAYSGPTGPEHWGTLAPEFAQCAHGQRQSPIDIRDGLPVELEPVQFDYRASDFWVTRSGHTLEMRVAPGNLLTIGSRRFELQRISLRQPAEERIGGRSFDMSLQLQHADEQGRLLMVSVLLMRGEPQPWVQAVLNDLPLEPGTEKRGRAPLDPALLLPSDSRYYTYMGSLTTPPCTEGVQWVVMRQPVSASFQQMTLVSRLITPNARPVQALAGRLIKQSP
jgi:carbonic anhydrase